MVEIESKCLFPWHFEMEDKIIKNMYGEDNVDNNRHEAILREITHIRFPNLVHLGLGGNNIESIEQLHQLELP